LIDALGVVAQAAPAPAGARDDHIEFEEGFVSLQHEMIADCLNGRSQGSCVAARNRSLLPSAVSASITASAVRSDRLRPEVSIKSDRSP
jgi:hypothetical protein